MKQKRYFFRVIKYINYLLILFFLVSCQSTPETPPIVNRGGGLPEGAVCEPLPEGEMKEIGAPAYWKETITRRDGALIISADTSVNVPQISNTPVIELEQKELTEEKLKEYVKYFTGNSELYKVLPLTKNELGEILEDMENKEGYYASPSYINVLTERINNLKMVIESAPDVVSPKKIDVMFTYPEKNEAIQITDPLNAEQEITSDNTFEALVKTNQSFYAKITATKYDTKVGSTSCFKYSNGKIYTPNNQIENIKLLETNLSKQSSSINNYMPVSDEWIDGMRAVIDNAQKIMDEVTISSEWAQKQADKVLSDLGTESLALDTCEKGIQFFDDKYMQYELNRQDLDFANAKGGYFFTYYREAGGLLACTLRNGYGRVSAADEAQFKNAPPFFAEYITVFVTDEGVQGFEWSNMSLPVGTVAENTNLLPFEDIKERYVQNTVYNELESSNSEHIVTDVKLRLTYCPAYNSPQNAWLIPVWVFEDKFYTDISGTMVYIDSIQSQFSAIDEAYIAPVSGSFIVVNE